MATTDYDFNQTRNEIIQRAFRIIGKLRVGQTLTGSQLNQGVVAINALVKEWQTRKVFLWTIVEDTQVLAASDRDYTLGNEVIHIDKAWYREGTSDYPVDVISWYDYQALIEKTTQNTQPTCIALDNSKSTPVMYVYPTPSAVKTLYFLKVVRLQDMDSASGNADIPQRFLNALTWGLAVDLADEYGLPIQERQHLRSRYEDYFDRAAKSDAEHTTVTFVRSAF